MVKKAILALMVVVGLGVGSGACTSSDVEQSKFESELVKTAGLTKAEAACVGERAFDGRFEPAEINKLYTAAEKADVPAANVEEFTRIVTECTAAPQ